MYRKWDHSGPRYRYTYASWSGMVSRCTNKNDSNFPEYGDKGILVCLRWRYSFDAFVLDMGVRPAGTSIDRIDNAGNYMPENCRWATVKEQAHNRRTNHLVTYAGQTLPISAWAEKLNMSKVTLHSYIRRHSPEKALARYLSQVDL